MKALWRFLSILILRLLLTSSWTTPNTASAGAPISAADYNTYVRDNLRRHTRFARLAEILAGHLAEVR